MPTQILRITALTSFLAIANFFRHTVGYTVSGDMQQKIQMFTRQSNSTSPNEIRPHNKNVLDPSKTAMFSGNPLQISSQSQSNRQGGKNISTENVTALKERWNGQIKTWNKPAYSQGDQMDDTNTGLLRGMPQKKKSDAVLAYTKAANQTPQYTSRSTSQVFPDSQSKTHFDLTTTPFYKGFLSFLFAPLREITDETNLEIYKQSNRVPNLYNGIRNLLENSARAAPGHFAACLYTTDNQRLACFLGDKTEIQTNVSDYDHQMKNFVHKMNADDPRSRDWSSLGDFSEVARFNLSKSEITVQYGETKVTQPISMLAPTASSFDMGSEIVGVIMYRGSATQYRNNLLQTREKVLGQNKSPITVLTDEAMKVNALISQLRFKRVDRTLGKRVVAPNGLADRFQHLPMDAVTDKNMNAASNAIAA